MGDPEREAAQGTLAVWPSRWAYAILVLGYSVAHALVSTFPFLLL